MLTKIFIILMIFSSACTSNRYEEKQLTTWDILESFLPEDWSMEKTISVMGEPDEKIPTDEGILLSYYDPQTKLQIWGISFSLEGKPLGITFIPHEKNPELFSDEAIKARWNNLNCTTKWERKKLVDIYKDNKILDCDQGHRAYYGKRDVISSISITKFPKPITSL